ncbi:non-ribosomal peptide synthetase [Burkholderia stabilis]|uniref:non-ribosomal peptide synthetase n=1 Tax=Burkholderia stabilis TaxID=95485 RepID=UPI000851957C|nr:non-ribosomal peptide synthetase [Burkholderia stabilis]AOR66754.1 non-ribosomal peptide synthetase [Burkholderia stabilis]HDR9491785.1 non-ribosomal peptide synthetase [Burkholderia stabilis]HDR9527906.1 non-ribosomal peptide synthetase [Burkholderia stabilis]HDR9530933.1 non-ribosomal peptide synthetase [Burkholderia stabilis]HDR9538473.1 non-ribosomal peptide synthetase [Burkholderia stabilis]
MTKVQPDWLALATRFAQLPDAQRAVFIDKLGAAGIDFRVLPIPPIPPRSDRVPASFAQTRLWLHARLIDAPDAYHITERLALTGTLDAHALRLACDALIARHEALRTTFDEAQDGVAQTIHAPLRCPWRETDLEALPDAQRAARAGAVATADEAGPFDLGTPPLVRAHLIRFDATHHWLALTVHHIVSDGWSSGVMLEELAAFYRAYASDKPVPLAPLPIQYADYALWQRRWLDAGERDRQLAFWRERLDPQRGVLTLPGATARPARRSARGARHVFSLDARVGAQLRAFAAASGATPFAVLLAALDALLARATGDARICVGVPAANRERAEVAGLIGFFVNTLAIDVDVPARGDFSSLVARTQRALVDAQMHQDVPFEQVVDALGVPRSASHHPLFQVMAAYGERRALPALGAAAAALLPSGTPSAKFDLTLSVEATPDGTFDAAFIYALDLFDADAIARLAARFVTLLGDALARPDMPVGDLDWLPADERAQLFAWNSPAGATDAEPFVPVHARIAAHAHARPDARGVADIDRALTRGEVDARAARLARHLVAAGVRPEMRVGVALQRSVDLLVALIAVLKSGAAFVPLDPAHPRERLAQIVGDANIAHVLTDGASAASLPELPSLRVWRADEIDALDEAADIALPDVLPGHAAYAIYTSGSTGKPKGVIVDHASFALHCAAIAERYGAGENDVFLLFQSVNFDGAHEGWFSQYMSGAAVSVTADVLWPPAQTCAMMVRDGVTMTYVPPGCAAQLAEWALAHGAPPTLRSLTVGGEATSREAFAMLRRALPNVRVVNGYGPTETVITPTLWMFRPGDDLAKLGDAAYLPIGTLVGARTAHVLDERLHPLPVGVIGELYLGGEGIGVARGYLDRPALTAERFVPDPYGAPGARLYRTGDLVRRRADGVFDFIGRVDHQVKLRGLRIELGEIEAQLAAHDAVREACAVVHGQGALAQLVAYVELTADAQAAAQPVEAATLDAHLRRTLPDYMVPAQLIVLDALPRNANSKVDRARLPAPVRVERAYEAPHDGDEAALAAIWCDVLNLERVGRGDHFFDLGGHSLAAVRVATRVAERLGRDVPVRALFEAPVLAQYALQVADAPRAEHAGAAAPGVALAKPDVHGVWPLSPAQLGLWFLWRAQPDSAAYNIPVALRVRGPLDIDALRGAFSDAAAVHPALRARLVVRDGALPGQRIDDVASVTLPVIDLSAQPDALARATALTDADALTPFDLAAGTPLWRARVLRLGADDHVLSVTIHHIVSDGDSIELWLDAVRARYVARVRGGASAEAAIQPAVPLVLPAPCHPARVAYWRDALADLPSRVLPQREDAPAVPQWRAARIAFEFDASLIRAARDAASAAHATLPMLLHAALNTALFRATGAADQPVGVLASTRELTGDAARAALGLFINSVVVRTRIDPAARRADVLAQVRDTALAAYAHADVPFADVVAALRAPRAAQANPLFQVMFNYLRPTGAAARDWAGLSLEDFDDVRHRVVFTLELDVVEHPDGRVSAAFSYADELLDRGLVDALVDVYHDEVARFAGASEAALGAPDTHAVSPASGRDQHAAAVSQASHAAAVLAALWSDTFSTAAPEPDADLFEAGATSFDIVRFVDAAGRAGHALTVADVFARPTLAALGARLDAQAETGQEERHAG